MITGSLAIRDLTPVRIAPWGFESMLDGMASRNVAAVLLLLGGLAPTFADPKVGTIGTATKSMKHARQDHSVVTLDGGRVAIIGGFDGAAFATPKDVEVFDPSTKTWKLASPMKRGRRNGTATRVADGRVVVIGGSELDARDPNRGQWSTSDAAVWDPKADQWTTVKPPAEPRSQHTATLVNGQVVIAGGKRDFGPAPTAEVFDPATNTFTSAGTLVRPRIFHAAVVANNKLAIIGGTSVDWRNVQYGKEESNDLLASIEVWDATTKTWKVGATLDHGRANPTATVLADGRVLVVGGEDKVGFVAPSELCDLTTNKCTPAGSLTTARTQHAAVLLADGRVVISGGQTGKVSNPDFVSTLEVWSPTPQKWTVLGKLAEARSDHEATVLKDGSILIVGGEVKCGQMCVRSVGTVEIVKP
jgi:hypothetical protein